MKPPLPVWWQLTRHEHSEGVRFWIVATLPEDDLDPPAIMVCRQGITLRGKWEMMSAEDQLEFEQVWAHARLLFLDLLIAGA